MVFLCQKLFFGENGMKNVAQKPTHHSPSDISYRYDGLFNILIIHWINVTVSSFQIGDTILDPSMPRNVINISVVVSMIC